MKQVSLRRAPALLLLALALAGALLLPAAAADDTGLPSASPPPTSTPTPGPVPVTGVTIDTISEQLRTLDKGKTLQLTCRVLPEDATDKSVTWESDKPAVAAVDQNGLVTAVAPGKATITVTTKDGGKKVTCEITVSGITLSKTSLQLLVDQSESLTCVCYGAAAGKNVIWSSSNPSVADGKNGRIAAHYPGSTTITATVDGTSYEVECSVTVKENMAEAIEGSLDSGGSLSFDRLASTLNSRSREKTGSSLNYLVNLSVATGQGVLYYGYVSPDAHGHGVGGTEKYYYSPAAGQPAITDLTFVPQTGFSGDAMISYKGYAANGVSFDGIIRVAVEENGDVTYSTAEDRPLFFTSEDFIATCREKTGRSVKSLVFEQPQANRGTLYYNYNPAADFAQKISTDDKFYTTSTPSVDSVAFVPAKGWTGTVTVPYTCTDSAGGVYRGKVTITVYSPSGSGSDKEDEDSRVSYSSAVNKPVWFDADDFNEVCRRMTGGKLDYVYFELPSSTRGKLYYDYVSSSGKGSSVSANTKYFFSRSGRYWISDIAFVPRTNYSGTVTVPFRAVDSEGESFNGSVRITVGRSGNSTVIYWAEPRDIVEFSAADFNDACKDATGERLSYVQFTPPDTKGGKLYYKYNAVRDSGTDVDSSTSYYYNRSRYLDDVSFVVAPEFSGTVTIRYTGKSQYNETYSGVVEIRVAGEEEKPGDGTDDSVVYPFVDVDRLAYYYDAVQWAARKGIDRGTSATTFTPDRICTRGEIVTLLWRAAGSPAPKAAANPFWDVWQGEPYYDAVLWAVERGITKGSSGNTFTPNAIVTRSQAVTFLWRAVGSPLSGVGSSFTDVKLGDYYASAVRWGVANDIIIGTTPTTFSPDIPCSRAQIMTLLYRTFAQ